ISVVGSIFADPPLRGDIIGPIIGRDIGDIVGGDKYYGVNSEDLIAALEKSGVVQAAETAGLQRRTIIMLAQRLKPTENLSFDQALTQLEQAVETALDVIVRGQRGADDDAFVRKVLAESAKKIRNSDLDGGLRTIDEAVAKLKADHRRSQLTLL